jgi:hypothetical protein
VSWYVVVVSRFKVHENENEFENASSFIHARHAVPISVAGRVSRTRPSSSFAFAFAFVVAGWIEASA